MKTFLSPKALRSADAGHYWIGIKDDWVVGYLRRVGKQAYFCFQPPHGYFGGGSFDLCHDVLRGAIFVGPIPEPLICASSND